MTRYLLPLLCILSWHCGDDDPASTGDTTVTETTTTTTTGDSATSDGGDTSSGDPALTRYHIVVEGGPTLAGEVPQAEVDASKGGAEVGDASVRIAFESGDTRVEIELSIPSDGALPDTFAVGDSDAPAEITLQLDDTDYYSTRGSLLIKTCPREVGDKIVGELREVAVYDPFVEDDVHTIDGTFDVHVVAMNGAVRCEGDPIVEPNTCEGDTCASFGECCPESTCIFTCHEGCASRPECQGDPSGCATCYDGCMLDCEISGSCGNAYATLMDCGAQNGCLDTGAHDQECLRTSCCEEFDAAF